MSMKDYKIAQTAGEEQYKKDLADGVYPYLQVLEELTQNVEIVSEIPLGVVDIPLEQVVGTNGHGRSTSFAKNFMPLLSADTEFAHKWGNLSEIHKEEGLRDPIKCYEFRNRFYVIEGNKRISVLKFFGAVEFQAEVTRMIERADGSTASNVYQEFLKFYKITRVNYINFTKVGSYQLLLEYVSRVTKEEWDSDFQKLFKSNYYRFKNAYLEMCGRGMESTVADAFLEYLKIYSFDSMVNLTGKELTESLKKMWASFPLLKEETPVMLHMQPEDEKKKGLVGRIANALSGAPKKLDVAIVYGKTPENSSWTYGHELGKLYVEETMKETISITTVEDSMNQEKPVDEILEDLVADGKDVIFTATPVLISATQRAAVAHPKVKFLNCSVNMAAGHIRTYYGRMYEAKFLAGLVAGVMTESDRIAYVADYPISGMTASINAFSRGVQLVNPRAKVYLVWSALRNSDVPGDLARIGADVVSHQDFIIPRSHTRQYGVYKLKEDGSMRELAMPIWNWGLFYERILRSILSGSWSEEDDEEESHAINYWWGLSSGVVDIILPDSLPEGVKQMVTFYKKAIMRRSFSPFDGQLVDQEGNERSEKDGYLHTADIVTMDWLLDNVIGKIPEYDEFKSDAQDLLRNVKILGEDSEGVVAVGTPRKTD